MSNFKITALQTRNHQDEPVSIYYGHPGKDWNFLTPSQETGLDIKIPVNVGDTQEGALILRLSKDKAQIGAELHLYIGQWGNPSINSLKTSVVGQTYTSTHDLTAEQNFVQLNLQIQEDGGILIVGAIEIDPVFPPSLA